MKRQIMKRFSAFIVVLVITMLMTVPAYAGQWRVDNTGWWYQEDNGSYPRDAWRFIDGSWYYFYSNGYMAHDAWINGLYYVGPDGKWIQNVQKKLTQAQVENVFQRYWDNTGYSSANAISYWFIDKMTDRFAYIHERWYTGYHGEVTIDLITGDCIETGPYDAPGEPDPWLPLETKYLFNAWTY